MKQFSALLATTASLAVLSTSAEARVLGDKLMAVGHTPIMVQAGYSDQASYEHDQELMEWYLQAIRGAWFGFYRGFFHERRRPQSKCLSGDVESEIAEIKQFFAYGELY